MSEQARRVVVTGIGAITALGKDMPTTWKNLLAGVSGAGPITRFDTSEFLVKFACEVKDFDISEYKDVISPKEARRIDRNIQMMIGAAAQAMRQANLRIEDPEQANRAGTLVGTGIGGLETIYAGHKTLFEKGPKRVSPFVATYMLPNMAAGYLAICFNLRGPNFTLISACASGTHTVGEAAEIIRRGDADVMLAGGVEAPITPFGLAAFHRTGALSTRNDDPQRASRPFDAQRDGFVFGEGAGALVLESLEHAQARGATILAEVVGYGLSDDAYHISAPAEGGEGAARAMAMALRKAGVGPEMVDYINAHGTSTPLNDKSETEAIKAVFGEHAYRIPISSTKSMVGHLLGAAGVVEAAVCVQTILDGIIHPTINYEYPDPECDLDYVPNEPRKATVRYALSNSFGFGGHNASILLKAYEE
nr:beta-ketoacyl-ACP synthase II [Ardenticatena sp.]